MEKHGPEGAIAQIRDMQRALEERLELESRADMNLLSALLATGNYQVQGLTRDGGPVAWIQLLAGIRNVRDVSTHRLYFRWIILWHCTLMTSVARSGALVFYDRDRPFTDFNMECLGRETTFFSRVMQLLHFQIIVVVPNVTGQFIVKAITNLLPADQKLKVKVTSYRGMRQLLEPSDHQVPPQFYEDREFCPSFESCGDYQALSERQGMQHISLSLINVPGHFDFETARIAGLRKAGSKQFAGRESRELAQKHSGGPCISGPGLVASFGHYSRNSSPLASSDRLVREAKITSRMDAIPEAWGQSVGDCTLDD